MLIYLQNFCISNLSGKSYGAAVKNLPATQDKFVAEEAGTYAVCPQGEEAE